MNECILLTVWIGIFVKKPKHTIHKGQQSPSLLEVFDKLYYSIPKKEYESVQ